ncbi:hypothetical protein BKP35_16540 [Anaerobacillus arseniciselenatis]|uniref:CHASE domain-containing protein n=1 Tax=Anaerobacillus arseniciselenatis TaxID=85682 RepID=A0A1S2LAF4_9BACI|nr:hypothetical protein [Anaerobacillus arseniciselenatis]OIJ09462.1 hypothetical protein BKP35_16540 [Anaerobacillus arseniciselenatis]
MGKLMLVFMIFASSMVYFRLEFDQYLQKRAYNHLSYALDHAVHDAALFVDEELASEGYIVFSDTESNEAFKSTLSKNLPVDEELIPLHGYYFTDPISLIERVSIDHSFIDPISGNPIEFPYIYTHQRPINGKTFEKVIFGPSLLYIVETKVYNSQNIQQFPKVQEYKDG